MTPNRCYTYIPNCGYCLTQSFVPLEFVPYMERLFDEDVLLGGGWTVHESLRPLAYSTLADLVHHVRQLLPLTDLAIAAHLFSKNVHDESLPTRYVI